METYLDNSATTKCHEKVIEIVTKVMTEDYGNPSSKHKKGVIAENYLKQTSEIIAKELKVKEKEIYYTSGGTESNNWALIGTAMANRRTGNHIITTSIEHPAILQPLAYLEEQGFKVTYLPVDQNGLISMEELKAAITEETILVSTIHVNNEIGAVESVEEIGTYLKTNHPQIIYHIDAIQSFGKYRIYPKKMGIDLLSASGHKLYGPKGIGFLYIDDRVKITPMILGGGQQKGMRSGTDNVPGVAGLGVATSENYKDLDQKVNQMREQRRYLIKGLMEIPDIIINGPQNEEQTAPHIVSASFLDIRSEVLLHALEDKEIYVSAGSACSSNKKQKMSKTLQEIGLSPDTAEGTIRFSFCSSTTYDELDYCLEVLKEIVPMLRRFSRK